MLQNIKQYSYDAFSVVSLVGFGVFALSSVVLSPLYVTPVFIYSSTKTAYYALRFFHFEKYPDSYAKEIKQEVYMNYNHKFKKEDVDGLKIKLQAFEYKEKRDVYWKYTCKVAKGFIPIFGFISCCLPNKEMTSLKPQDTCSDAIALRYHIRLLNSCYR
jgi:hypothetical protein